jgi:hypothetical protein
MAALAEVVVQVHQTGTTCAFNRLRCVGVAGLVGRRFSAGKREPRVEQVLSRDKRRETVHQTYFSLFGVYAQSNVASFGDLSVILFFCLATGDPAVSETGPFLND